MHPALQLKAMAGGLHLSGSNKRAAPRRVSCSLHSNFLGGMTSFVAGDQYTFYGGTEVGFMSWSANIITKDQDLEPRSRQFSSPI